MLIMSRMESRLVHKIHLLDLNNTRGPSITAELCHSHLNVRLWVSLLGTWHFPIWRSYQDLTKVGMKTNFVGVKIKIIYDMMFYVVIHWVNMIHLMLLLWNNCQLALSISAAKSGNGSMEKVHVECQYVMIFLSSCIGVHFLPGMTCKVVWDGRYNKSVLSKAIFGKIPGLKVWWWKYTYKYVKS